MPVSRGRTESAGGKGPSASIGEDQSPKLSSAGPSRPSSARPSTSAAASNTVSGVHDASGLASDSNIIANAQSDADADADADRVEEEMNLEIHGAVSGHEGKQGQEQGQGDGYYPYMPHVLQAQSQSQSPYPHVAHQPSPNPASAIPIASSASVNNTTTNYINVAVHHHHPQHPQQQQLQQPQQSTPQHQLAYMHHAPPPMARPTSVHSMHSQMSMMAESEDDGEFLPIDPQLTANGGNAVASGSGSSTGMGMNLSVSRPDMQRAHSMSYIQTPYDNHAHPYGQHPHPHAQAMRPQHQHQHSQVHQHQGPSPYAQTTPLPTSSSSAHMLVPSSAAHPAQSPTDTMLFHSQQAMVARRPGMPQRHSTTTGVQRPGMQRQYSLQPPPPRGGATIGHDVFAAGPGVGSTPVRRVSGVDGMNDQHYYQLALQGISPARALGPAPVKAPSFPYGNALATPQTRGVTHIPSSISSTSVSSSSSGAESSTARTRRRTITGNSNSDGDSDDDGDSDSPTRPSRSTSALRMVNSPHSAPSSELSEEGEYQPKSPLLAPAKVNKPPVVCRTSAKLARTAEDPGVEGVPPGPRSMERPQPSFACIIGQAILQASAGGLSLEHIYRYVETAYPYFKTGDGAWRNSVRHNLSIHKMFGTIPRTEKFPPGKGGIWVIHEEEKIHWPSEGKFIKNFPASHPHHACCRQTMHERQKEQEAMAKALAEGKVYVPRKGKKGRKLATASSLGPPGMEEAQEMGRTESAMSDVASSLGGMERPGTAGGVVMMPTPSQQQMGMGMMPHAYQPHPHPQHPHAHAQMPMHLHPHHAQMQHQQQQMMPPPMAVQHAHAAQAHAHAQAQAQAHAHAQAQAQVHAQMNGTPGPLQPMIPHAPHPHMQMAPVQMRSTPSHQQHPIHPSHAMHQSMPRTSHVEEEFRPMSAPPPAPKRSRDSQSVEEDENVFTVPKRVRLNDPQSESRAQSQPLAPLPLQQQIPQHVLAQQGIMHVGPNGMLELDDAYVTPERERITNQKAAMSSGAFKTPALVDSSSSPTSSPMPPTLPRGAGAHNPSSLHQAWTNDDILSSASPSGFSLDAAFDIKPKVARKMDDDALWPPALGSIDANATTKSSSPKAPPKTPLTRSSAAADRERTPRHTYRTPFAGNSTFKTPNMFAGSPVLPRPMGHEMSTPAWELEGILDRLTGAGQASPSRSHIGPGGLPLGVRSPITSTDPSRYATLLSSGDGSPKGKSRVIPVPIPDSPLKRTGRHALGHVRAMGSLGSFGSLGSLGNLSAIGELKGALLPALKEGNAMEKEPEQDQKKQVQIKDDVDEMTPTADQGGDEESKEVEKQIGGEETGRAMRPRRLRGLVSAVKQVEAA